MIHQDPRLFNLNVSRWTLECVRDVYEPFQDLSLSGVSRLLDRLAVVYKRGRAHVHSPDPDYLGKLGMLRDVVAKSQAEPDRFPVLLEDEFSFYRRPTIARAWSAKGDEQQLAEMGHGSNTRCRIAAVLDIWTGAVLYRMDSRIGVQELITFLRRIREAYPAAEQISVVIDNWPVHYHPDLVAALCPQEFVWPLPNVKYLREGPSPQAKRWELPIRLISLPTYAPWTNPIEKLWRMLFQEVLHMHRLSENWLDLKGLVRAFIDGFASGSQSLLKYVGLHDPMRFYTRAYEQALAGRPLEIGIA